MFSLRPGANLLKNLSLFLRCLIASLHLPSGKSTPKPMLKSSLSRDLLSIPDRGAPKKGPIPYWSAQCNRINPGAIVPRLRFLLQDK
jgi:hypothetical protein